MLKNSNNIIGIIVLYLILVASIGCAQNANDELISLNQEFSDLFQNGEYDHAIVVAKRAIEVAEKDASLHPPIVAASLSNLALLYYTLGRYDEAEPLFKRVLVV